MLSVVMLNVVMLSVMAPSQLSNNNSNWINSQSEKINVFPIALLVKFSRIEEDFAVY
jgi:hypothetical protein